MAFQTTSSPHLFPPQNPHSFRVFFYFCPFPPRYVSDSSTWLLLLHSPLSVQHECNRHSYWSGSSTLRWNDRAFCPLLRRLLVLRLPQPVRVAAAGEVEGGWGTVDVGAWETAETCRKRYDGDGHGVCGMLGGDRRWRTGQSGPGLQSRLSSRMRRYLAV